MKRIIIAMLAVMFFAGAAYGADSELSVSVIHRDTWGGSNAAFGYITLSSGTYPTAAFSLTAGQLGFNHLEGVTFFQKSGLTYIPNYISASSLLTLSWTQTNTVEVTDDTAPANKATSNDADYFRVTDDNSAATNGMLMCIVPMPGGDAAYIATLESFGISTEAMVDYYKMAAADSATVISLYDSAYAPLGLRDGSLVYGDTLWFDDNGSNYENRLYYTGVCLGDRGTLYVPYAGGRMLKVQKTTNATLIDLAATPLYFDKDVAGLDDKVLSVNASNANSSFSADITYSSIAQYRAVLDYVPAGTTLAQTTYYFIAVGY